MGTEMSNLELVSYLAENVWQYDPEHNWLSCTVDGEPCTISLEGLGSTEIERLLILKLATSVVIESSPEPIISAEEVRSILDSTRPTYEEWIADTESFGGSREEYDRLYGGERLSGQIQRRV